MSKINYIIATYSGKKNYENETTLIQNRPWDALQIHLNYLKLLLENKLKHNIPIYISQITIVEPIVHTEIYDNYYQKDKWQSICGIPVIYQILDGNNVDHSYDQFLQGMLKNKSFDYHITLEDDYYINPNLLNFEDELIQLYKEKFPNNIGYLCTYASFHPIIYTNDNIPPKSDLTNIIHYDLWHGAISNGMISKDTLEHLGDNILNYYYNFWYMYPQLKYSFIMYKNNVNIADITSKYRSPFWNSVQQSLKDFAPYNNIYLFLPIQLTI